MKVYIINPDNGKAVSVEEWRKDAKPTRAHILAIDDERGHTLLMSKKYLRGLYDFEEAKKACSEFIVAELGNSNITFRCPSKKESAELYDALSQGLHEAIELTGGNFGKPGKIHWTCEQDHDPRYLAAVAWCEFGGLNNSIYSTFSVLPVAIKK